MGYRSGYAQRRTCVSGGIERGRFLATPAGENLFEMKSSPGKRQHRVFHTLLGFRISTVFRKRNRANAKKPQTGAGWFEAFSVCPFWLKVGRQATLPFFLGKALI
jgi:hypothetical protein